MKIKQFASFDTYNGKVVKCKLIVDVLVQEGFPVFQTETIGIAKCHPDDTFDETTGMRIAESKATMKAYRQVAAFVMKKAKEELDYMTKIKENLNKLKRLVKTEHNHFDNLMREVNEKA